MLPDGCMDLIWDGSDLKVAGPDTRAHVFHHDGGAELTGLRLPPGHGPLVVGVPADELVDGRVPLDALWGAARVRRITDALSTSAAVSEVLEDIVLEERSVTDPETLLIEHIVALASAGHTVSAIADEVGLSTRQLQRKSLAAFGYGPKMLARILRLQRALRLSHEGAAKVDAAARAGYADQPHMSREVKEFAGVSLGVLTH